MIQTIITNSILARPIKNEKSNANEGLSRKILLLCNVDENSNKKQIQFIAMFFNHIYTQKQVVSSLHIINTDVGLDVRQQLIGNHAISEKRKLHY